MSTQPTFALLDPAACGANLEIRESGLVAVCNQTAVNGSSRMKVRGSIPKISGSWMFEVAYWGDDIPTGGLVSAGICTQASTLNSGAGVDANSYALMMADGGIWSNSVQLTASQPTAAKTYVQVVVDLDNNLLKFYCGGTTPFATQAITPASLSRVYYPCVTVGSVTASFADHIGVGIYVNFGQRAFSTQLAQLFGIKGWYSQNASPPAVYIGPAGDRSYASAATDTPANQIYRPGHSNVNDLQIGKEGTIWTQVASDDSVDGSDSATYSQLVIDNSMNEFQGLIDLQDSYRNCPVYFRQLTDQGGRLQDVSTTIATCLVDQITQPDENTINITLKDLLESDNVPLQQRIFPPWADPGSAGLPFPKVIGAARSVNVGEFLVSGPDRLFQLNDDSTSIGVLRDKGNPLDTSQYVLSGDLQAVIPDELPNGLFTADIGASGTTPAYPAAPDALGGNGSNWDTAWAGGNGAIPSPIAAPPGWTLTNTDSPAYTSSAGRLGTAGGFAHQMVTMTTNRPISAISAGHEFSLKQASGTPLRAGKRYRISVNIQDYQNASGLPNCGLVMVSAWDAQRSSWITPYFQPSVGVFHSDVPVVYYYTVPPGADRNLYVTVVGAGPANQPTTCTFYDIEVQEVAETAQPVPLIGSTFVNYFDTIFRSAGIPQSEWSRTDCTTLDALYPGGPIGVQLKGAGTTRKSALMLPLTSIGAVVQVDRLGVRRFRRWNDPAGRTPVATHTEREIDYPIVRGQDLAPGLTLTVGCQRNWTQHGDADMVTDTDLVPPALRTQLKRISRIQQTCNLQLGDAYMFARMAAAFDTVFDDPVLALNELLRMVRPYSPPAAVSNGVLTALQTWRPPQFLTYTINYQGVPPEYLFGTILGINYKSPRARGINLVVNQNVAVFKTVLMPGRQKMQIMGLG